MHKGRNYPYHWRYWATECFFWPGYVPWQLFSVPILGNASPWDAVAAAGHRHSFSGTTVPDSTQISWTFFINAGPGWNSLVVSLEQETIGGKNWAVWAATLYTIFITGPTVWLFQPAPLRVCISPGFQWWDVHDPFAPPAGPHLGFRPARWSEVSEPPHQ